MIVSGIIGAIVRDLDILGEYVFRGIRVPMEVLLETNGLTITRFDSYPSLNKAHLIPCRTGHPRPANISSSLSGLVSRSVRPIEKNLNPHSVGRR